MVLAMPDSSAIEDIHSASRFDITQFLHSDGPLLPLVDSGLILGPPLHFYTSSRYGVGLVEVLFDPVQVSCSAHVAPSSGELAFNCYMCIHSPASCSSPGSSRA